jgi:hypothetical protein
LFPVKPAGPGPDCKCRYLFRFYKIFEPKSAFFSLST